MFWRRQKEDADKQDSAASLFEQVDRLVAENRHHRDPEREREILRLRHRAGAALLVADKRPPKYASPAAVPPTDGSGLPEIRPEELTAERVRGGMLQGGCVVIRGLISSSDAEAMVEDMERAFEARERVGENGTDEDAYWQRFEPDPPFVLQDRDWVSSTGSIWAADSPRLMFETLDMFERAGLRDVITGYLGERPSISVNKCTLRKVDASAGTAWHQDGAFLGEGARALNVWLSLSDCGVDAPGLDLVPRRLDHIVPTGTEGAIFDWSVSDALALEAAGEAAIVRPTFAPGDVVLFDHFNLHRTAVEPQMPNTRYAIESWFFGPTGFPGDYTPIAF